MKPSLKLVLSLLFVGFVFSIQTTEAQFLKKLKKKAEKAAENAVIKKTEEKVSKETSKKMDTILGNKKKGDKGKGNNPNAPNSGSPTINSGGSNGSSTNAGGNGMGSVEVYSKFDYVPGDKLIFFEDFEKDYIGDFPSKWNTNGSGEVVTFNSSPEKWLEIQPGTRTFYIPNLPSTLPEEYTLEFDVFVIGVDRTTSSSARLGVLFDDNDSFKRGNDFVRITLPFCQYTDSDIGIMSYVNGEANISNHVETDMRQAAINTPHISIAVNKTRYRLWVNEKKYVDIPKLVSPNKMLKYIKFHLYGFKDTKERLFLRNIKLAEGGIDLRRKLIEEGKVSTNGILFDSGSANIQPRSMGIIRQISQVLQQEPTMNLTIVGHTDADGPDETNLELSKKRAAAVKDALINVYKISGDRLQTDGKGESLPVGDNNTPDGKAQNRRVEFIKIN